jgi:hypothetical protein
MTGGIQDVIERYRQGAIAHGDTSNPKKANKGAKQLHACYKVLRESEVGREALISLMEDREPNVRGWAAAHCLQWAPKQARPVLEALSKSDVPWQLSSSAEMTLQEYDKGRLTFEY